MLHGKKPGSNSPPALLGCIMQLWGWAPQSYCFSCNFITNQHMQNTPQTQQHCEHSLSTLKGGMKRLMDMCSVAES